jgi:signal transduction histidine kinase
MKNNEGDSFDHLIVKRLFPLAFSLPLVYIPYSFLVSHEYLAGWAEVGVLIALLVLRIFYFKYEHTNILSDMLIFLGFPVLLPWLLTGGPAGHGLWWAPVYVLWISFFARKARFLTWVSAFLLSTTGVVVLSAWNIVQISYSISELLNILFAYCISTALIYLYEMLRAHQQDLREEEMRKRLRTQTKYNDLLDNTADAIIVANREGEIILTNRLAEEMLGDPGRELLGRKFEELSPDKVYFTQPGSKIERMAPGPLYTVPGSSDTPVSSGDAKEGAVPDTATQQVMEQNKRLTDFARIASHDLRGPITNLSVIMEFVKEESTIEGKEEMFNRAESLIKNLNNTFDELLEITFSTTATNETEELLFDAVFKSVQQLYAQQIAGLKALVITNFKQAPRVRYPLIYLKSIFSNLLSNSLRYHVPGRTPIIHFETEMVKGHIRLTVSDNGLGIDLEKHRDKIFGMHQTFHQHAASKGVGLYIVKAQIENLGGSIHVRSRVNEGTTFEIRFSER